MEMMLKQFTDVERSLTDPWEMPEDSEVQNFDPEVLLGAIMLKGSDLQPVFTDPKQFYMMNQIWWKKWVPTFSKWCEVVEKEYEPLWDRDGFEEIVDHTEEQGTLDTATTGKEVVDDDTTGTRGSTEVVDDDTTYSGTSKVIEQASGKDTTTHNSDRDTDVTNSVSAFDSNTYQPHDHSHTDDILNSETTETTYGKKVQTDGEESGSGTDDKTTTFQESTSGTDDRTTTTNGTVDTDTTGEKDYEHKLHSWGNWGISQTVQKLKKQELDIQYWNVYEHMSDIFLDEMTVRVF
jgi:hypothetical protein